MNRVYNIIPLAPANPDPLFRSFQLPPYLVSLISDCFVPTLLRTSPSLLVPLLIEICCRDLNASNPFPTVVPSGFNDVKLTPAVASRVLLEVVKELTEDSSTVLGECKQQPNNDCRGVISNNIKLYTLVLASLGPRSLRSFVRSFVRSVASLPLFKT